MRRYHMQLDYLRVIESHKDGYPHVHILFQFPDARIRVENARYFDKKLYARWKGYWRYGHSDYQKPRGRGLAAISYVMKYLLKNQTQKTVWKKVYASYVDVNLKESLNQSDTAKNTTVCASLEKPPVKYCGIKLCTWSRGFDFSVFLARRPESVVKGLKY
jgi:hypothetical protein